MAAIFDRLARKASGRGRGRGDGAISESTDLLRKTSLSKRVSSIIRSYSSLCHLCRLLDFSDISRELDDFHDNPDGVFLGWLSDTLRFSGCGLCQVLSQFSIAEAGSKLQLRAFQLRPHMSDLLANQQYVFEQMPSGSDIFVAVVPDRFSLIPGSDGETKMKSMVANCGFLVYADAKTTAGRTLSPHLVQPDFDAKVVRDWLTVCQSEHARCQVRQRRKLSQNLIDCRDRTILRISDVASEDCPEYVALSYVWGDSAHQQEKASTSTDKADLPSTLPQVVQDAMQVALKLGYHYLWVDKYCIDHWDKQRKHEQMMHMDSVYQNATLTIVAAAGPDESYGLPGISRRRSSKQVSFEGDNFTLKSILPLPHHSITSSRWASRGWTYQEAILSRRRLVFTEDQLYFECDSTSCCESFRVSKSIQPSGGEPDSSPLSQPSLFCLKRLPAAGTSRRATTRLSNFFTYVNCTKEYSSRSLSYDRDSLTAFSGIIRELESSTAFPVRHIWGIPLFHPDDDNLSVAELQSTYQSFRVAPLWKSASETGCNFAFPSAGAPQGLTWGYSLDTPSLANERVDYLAFLLLGLSWSHESACGARPPRRRIDLPSWSWTGWQGAVAWPALEQSSKVRSLAWLATRIALGDSHTESVPAMYHKGTDLHLLEQSNKSLFITTLAMARTAFSLDKANNRLCLNTGQRVRLRPSKNDMDVPKVHKRLQSGRYEAIVLAMVDQDAFLMLVKKYRNAYYRIGTMSVNVAYLTMSLFTSEVKTYKLR